MGRGRWTTFQIFAGVSLVRRATTRTWFAQIPSTKWNIMQINIFMSRPFNTWVARVTIILTCPSKYAVVTFWLGKLQFSWWKFTSSMKINNSISLALAQFEWESEGEANSMFGRIFSLRTNTSAAASYQITRTEDPHWVPLRSLKPRRIGPMHDAEEEKFRVPAKILSKKGKIYDRPDDARLVTIHAD